MSWPNHLTKLSNESYNHFVAKAILFWILRDIQMNQRFIVHLNSGLNSNVKHDVSSEWKVPYTTSNHIQIKTVVDRPGPS